jgi:hypothetical protein
MLPQKESGLGQKERLAYRKEPTSGLFEPIAYLEEPFLLFFERPQQKTTPSLRAQRSGAKQSVQFQQSLLFNTKPQCLKIEEISAKIGQIASPECSGSQ